MPTHNHSGPPAAAASKPTAGAASASSPAKATGYRDYAAVDPSALGLVLSGARARQLLPRLCRIQADGDPDLPRAKARLSSTNETAMSSSYSSRGP